MTELLLYPQVVLLLAPVLLRGIWAAGRASLDAMAPRDRARVLFVLIVLPVAAIGVPYIPALAPHLSLPWRAPIAWGIANFPAPTDWVAHTILTIIAAMLVVVPPAALALLLARSARTAHNLSARLGGEPHQAGFILVPGRAVACTIGLWRPRVFLSADIWASGHGTTILAHEQAHAHGRHNLLLVIACASLTLWWWLPGTRRLLADFRQALEESADASAARRHGRTRVARAILDTATTGAPMPALGFGGGQTLERRVLTLSRDASVSRTRAMLIASTIIAILWIVLL
ncbi:M56 family metallopeptidase [Microbacterium sp. CH-015]|uniref:M56 family metallopeptidase n=1 Tax=Microbacterium sp. CH-015 TaxID=3406734 RepID=UPI003C75F94F